MTPATVTGAQRPVQSSALWHSRYGWGLQCARGDAVGSSNNQLPFNGEGRPQQQVLPPLVPVHPVPHWTGIGLEIARKLKHLPSLSRTLDTFGCLLPCVLSAKLKATSNNLSLDFHTE